MKKKITLKRILALVLAATMMVTNFQGMGTKASAATSGDYYREADPSTLDGWKEYFGDSVLSTEDSGSIWTDKTVLEAASSVQIDNSVIPMVDTDKNFLVSLSAIASNKTVTGMTAVPTDTIMVLDLSSSMNGNVGALATAANNALKELARVNPANRMGVVVYAGNVNNNWNHNVAGKAIVLMPLDTYDTSRSGGNYLTSSGNTLMLASNLRNSSGNTVSASRATSTGTYTQDGIYTAMEAFQAADLSGANAARVPIMVLMSDGAPTMGTVSYANVNTCDVTDTSENSTLLAVLNQLTAAYARAKIEAKYNKTAYIYTLGLGIDDKEMAKAVMNPAASNLTTNHWNNLVNNGSVSVGGKRITRVNEITRASQRIYTDGYFSASRASDLNNAFSGIISEIVLQSKYLPTLSESGKENVDGYVSFIDRIGKYMEVTDVKGVMIAGTLHTGANLAKLIKDGGMGHIDAPTIIGDKLVWALQQRLGIADTNEVRGLIQKAYVAGQLSYTSDTEFTNYIGWYSDENNNYIDFWDGGAIDTSKGATYVNKSYLYLGEVNADQGVQESDMMYTIVQKRHNIATREEVVIFGVPANLIPLVTYEVSKNENDQITDLQVTGADYPIRMVYEVSLWEGIHEHNVEQLVEAGYAHRNPDGSYYFYTNRWDHDLESEDTTSNTYAYFRPSLQNERYYYAADAVVYSDTNGTVFKGTIDVDGTYYRGYTVYVKDGASYKTETHYEKISAKSLNLAEKQSDGSYIIPAGTIHTTEDAHNKQKSANLTETIAYEDFGHVEELGGEYIIAFTQGNNGRLTLVPEDTKSVSITKADSTVITDGDGKVVMVGDTLTYTIKVVNHEAETVNAVVTDVIPAGTVYVDGSASHSGVLGTNSDGKAMLTWNLQNVAPGEEVEVSFQVLVTEAALDMAVISIDNTASIQMGDEPVYKTNTTTNPPEGKKAANSEGESITGEVSVGDVLVYRIRYYNDSESTADVIITDIIPEGTTYVENSASHNGTYNAADNTVTWTIPAVTAGANGVVSFRVAVNANAVSTIENDAAIKIGSNDPRQTNKTTTEPSFGDLKISKTIVVPEGYSIDSDKEFTLTLTESTFTADGTFVMLRNGDESAPESVTFVDGMATVTIKHGDTLEICDIPAGTHIVVTELAEQGYTPSYSAADRVTIVTDGTVSVAVTNTYDADAAVVTLTATKVLTTGTALADTTFGFMAYPCDVNGNITDTVNYLTGEATVSSDNKTVEFNFSPLTFTTPGTYRYLVYELNGGMTGMLYSQTEYLVEITVSDNGSGILVPETRLYSREGSSGAFADASAMSFTNEYQPLGTSLVLEGTKVLTGRQLKDGEFGFEVKDALGNVVTTGMANADGTISFKPISYNSVITTPVVYTITEINGGLVGVNYDTASFQVSVTVADVNGQLVATAVYPDGGVVFANTFTPDDVTVVLEADKVLVDHNGDPLALSGDEFSFVVTEGTEEVAYGTNDASGHVVFSPIVYDVTDVGTHTYVIKEIVPDVSADPNMKYDETGFTVEVVVSYDSSTGILSTTVNYVDGAAQFHNIQNPSSVEITPVADKSTLNAPAETSFSFVVINAVTGDNAGAGVGAANGAVTFSVMSYSEVGTYTYWIREANAGSTVHGITYDATQYLMKVVVERDANHKLVADVTYWALKAGGDAANAADYTEAVTTPSFQNEYNANGYLNITATKQLNGRDLKDGEFAFKLVRKDGTSEIEGVADASGKITFATMYYDLEDLVVDGVAQNEVIIEYVMTEVVAEIAKLPGVTYDTNSYSVYVKLTNDGSGNIIAELVDASGVPLGNGDPSDTGITFTNNYQVVQGTSAVIEATKSLIGRDLKAGEFSFHLYHVTGGVEVLVETSVNDADGNVKFVRNYPASMVPGTYEYEIREFNNQLGGVSYSTAVYKVFVIIVDNGDGTLGASVAYADSERVFENTYQATGTSYTPAVNKVLTGRAMTGDNEFAFEVKTYDPVTGTIGQLVSTGLSRMDGSVVFTAMGYNTVGEYHYVITEVAGSLHNVTYDTKSIYLKVTVTDPGNGQLEKTAVYYDDAGFTQEVTAPAFHNVYTPDDVAIVLQASKEMTGRDMEAGEFSFVVTDKATGDVVATGGNTTAGSSSAVIFSNINIPSADVIAAGGTLVKTYVISEKNTGAGGVTYTTATYEVTVTVTHNTTSGLLEVTYSYPNGEIPVFANSYQPAPAEVALKAYKQLINKVLEAGEFSFLLKTEDGQTVLQTKTNDANGVVSFDALTFDRPGTYMYQVVEDTSAADANYTYDQSVITVVIKVTDDGKGQLRAVVTYYEGYTGTAADVDLGSIEFVNSYTPDPLTLDLSAQIGATKEIITVDGVISTTRDLEAGEFTFEVKDVVGNVIGTATNDADGNIIFPAFTFDKAGEYHYWIAEKTPDPAIDGITIDPTVWELHIVVRYDATTGMLYIGPNDGQIYPVGQTDRAYVAPVFRNVYDPVDANLQLTLKKSLTGRDLRAEEFVFLLVEESAGGEVVRATGRNAADGTVILSLTYDQAGVYNYKLRELKPNVTLGGVTYDQAEYDVKVTVVDDGEGHLVVTEVIVDGTQVADAAGALNLVDTGVIFKNVYAPAPVSLNLLMDKVLTGKNLLGGEFLFQLIEMVGGTEVVYAQAANGADGKVILHATFEEARTYHFILREDDSNKLSNITYDPATYEVVVTVVDDGHGSLKVTEVTVDGVDVTNGINVETGVQFTNSYMPHDTALVLEGTKNLIGRQLKDGEFGYEVKDEHGNVVTTGMVNADGTITFRPITYDRVITTPVVYTITEINGGLHGVTYDPASFEVSVTVADVNGQLVATAVYPAGGVVFTNTYTPDPVTAVLNANKTLVDHNGSPLALDGDEFSFVVKEGTREVAYGTNDENGKIVFSPIVYTVADVGVHTYTITEIVPDVSADPNMKYDVASFTVIVTVSYDDVAGVLSTEVTYPAGGVEFLNIQNPASVEITPAATKTTADAPDGTSFSFEVVNTVTGHEAGTGVGAANGNVAFSVMSYSEEGTYTYWIREAHAGMTVHGITYDAAQYLMKVVVERDSNNKLIADVTYWALKDGGNAADPADYTDAVVVPSFINQYAANGYLNITATKVLTGRDLKDGEFAFKLTREGAGHIDGVVDASGKITFATLYYDLDDLNGLDEVIIKYTMTEVVPEAAKLPGVTYDTNSYDVYVKLTHDDAGNIQAELVDASGVALGTTDTGITFNNTYKPVEGTTAVIEAQKELTGRALKAGEFGFHLYHVTGGVEVLVETSVNDANGNVKFVRNYPATMTPGTYEYEIREFNNALGGVTYSTEVFKVSVTITDNGDGTLSAAVAYADAERVFHNTYDAGDINYTPAVNKVLVGRPMTEDNEFAFEVTEDKVDGQVVSTGLSKADGSVVFTPIGFEAAGTYRYTITEVVGNLHNIIYDSKVIYLEVVVTDDHAGNLLAEANYYEDSTYTTKLNAPTFNNIYMPDDVEIVLQAVKELTGRQMAAEEFEFVVLDEEGTVVATGKNISDGTTSEVVFTGITVQASAVGMSGSRLLTYTIAELNTNAAGVTYSDALFEVKVKVTHNTATGMLELTYYYPNDEIPVFRNVYEAVPVALELKAYKELINRTLEVGEFTFQLVENVGGVEVIRAEATNDENGEVVLSLTFDEARTYELILRENSVNGLPGVIYDDKTYAVTVKVVDDGQGQLVIESVKVDGVDKTLDVIVDTGVEFVNTYTPEYALVDLVAKKRLEGKTLKDGQFTFELVEYQTGKVVMTATNKADGTIVFEELSLTAVGTYTYIMREVIGDDDNIVYDKKEYVVIVTVTDDPSTGKLQAKVQYGSQNVSMIEFVNRYEKPDGPVPPASNPDTGDGARVGLWMSLMATSMLAAAGAVVADKKKRRV